MADTTTIVRDCFAAYETGDRELLERHLADDFRFFSPQDDGIDRATYFARCWPAHDALRSFTLRRLVADGDDVIVTYDAERADGTRFRNTEIHTLRDGRVTRVEVYFGWNL